jgi:hypothetical protein
MYNRMKLPYFGLNVRILFQIYFGSGFESGFGSGIESGFESGSETFISVLDRIRIQPKVSDPSGSGSATLRQKVFRWGHQPVVIGQSKLT